MAANSTPMLLVTANVGSIFEDPTIMLKIWTEEFLATVTRLDPKFIALHCQEVGGKNYEQSMKHVEHFVRLLMASEELRLFDKVRVYLDEDYSSAEKFTALGNFYFVHKSVDDVLIWDFKDMNFIPVDPSKEINSGSIEDVTTKEKSKFPQDFFPECKWSRKGFLRTRWSVNGTVFDLINIHLFHDASNFVAMESFPSIYCKNRRRALEHTLDRFHSDDYGTAPFFLFGDFNFRTDTQGVVKKLVDGLNAVPTLSTKCNSQEYTKMQYLDGNQVVLSLGKKEFRHSDHQKVFVGSNGLSLKEFDRELEPFSDRLFEFGIDFPPSYPFEEDETGARCYMQTRCPAWCDRVVLSHSARELLNMNPEKKAVEYGLMGRNACMGDHKPVYLMMELLSGAGRVACCSIERPCAFLLLLLATVSSASTAFPSPSLSTCTTCTVCTPEECDELEHQHSGSMHGLATHPNPSMPLPCPPPKFHRAHSASAVERPPYALSRAKCRCLSDSSWQPLTQHRLIANAPSRQLSRFSSHHSSSEEEWFEVIAAEGDDSDQTQDTSNNISDSTHSQVTDSKTENTSVVQECLESHKNSLNQMQITVIHSQHCRASNTQSSSSSLDVFHVETTTFGPLIKLDDDNTESDETKHVIESDDDEELNEDLSKQIDLNQRHQSPILSDLSLSVPKDILSSLDSSHISKCSNEFWSCSGETGFASCASQSAEVTNSMLVLPSSPTKDLTDKIPPFNPIPQDKPEAPLSARKKFLCCTFL